MNYIETFGNEYNWKIKFLNLKNKIDLNAVNDSGENALHIACEKGNFEIVKYLISLDKINLTHKNDDKETILHKACYSGNLELVKYLVPVSYTHKMKIANKRKN